jgi:hypothetical protein
VVRTHLRPLFSQASGMPRSRRGSLGSRTGSQLMMILSVADHVRTALSLRPPFYPRRERMTSQNRFGE